jgi:hypothetical protein
MISISTSHSEKYKLFVKTKNVQNMFMIRIMNVTQTFPSERKNVAGAAHK